MSKRHVLWWMLVFQLVCSTLITTSMNIAIVSMVQDDDTLVLSAQEPSDSVLCPNRSSFFKDYFNGGNQNTTILVQMRKFKWSKAERNMILSGFFWLSYFTILPGGVLAHEYGSKRVVGYATMISGAASSAIPFVARYGATTVCWVRAFQGLLLSVALPAGTLSIVGKWSPPHERGKFGSVFAVSAALSATLGDFIFGFMARYWNWEYVFYATSVYSGVWSVLWFWSVYDSPAQHPGISAEEKKFIESSLKTSNESDVAIPWRKIAGSGPVIIYMVATNAVVWSFVMVNTYSPIYLKMFYGMESNEIGIVTSVPSLLVSVLSLIVAYGSDKLVENKISSITGVRKMCTFLGGLSAVPLVIIAFTKCGLNRVIGCLLLVVVIRTFSNFGALLGSVDLSPKFCGVLEGVCGTLSTFQVFVFSGAINYLTENSDIEELWKATFLFTALFYVLTNAIFLVFGTAEVQRWNFEDKGI